MVNIKLSNLVTEQLKKDPGGIATLHSSAMFHALLRHERSRANRDGSEFSLAVFDISHIISSGRGMRQIVCVIRTKMRSIDEMGWLDERNVGVLLPVTNLTGGRKFAARVSESVTAAVGFIPWTVFTYPAHWLSGGNGGSGSDSPPGTAGRHFSTEEDHFSAVRGHAFCLRIPSWKRCMDIVGSLVLIAVLSPMFLLIATYIRAVSPGKVLFRQKRVGYQGELFTFLKFRTMKENNDPRAHRDYLKELIKGDLPMEKLDVGTDPRIIPGGRILRKACLDELPQLFNVLRGEMSLVGPRPCIPYEAEEYQRWHTHRFDILPGMTGLWQVSGKNKLSFVEMIRFDIAYANKLSPLLDLKILILTVPTVIALVFEASMNRFGKKGRSPRANLLYEGSEKGTVSNA
jgi:lipopolysaccharide/colanic/teichoic acid biosynthesis glycosyltransferase